MRKIKKPAKHTSKDYFLVDMAIGVRLANDFFMLVFPLPGLLLSIFWDIMDTYCFILGDFTRKEYHLFDKVMDYIHYLFVLLISYNLGTFNIIFAWFVFRSIGHVIHLFFKNDKIFIIFPNVFEYLVLAELIFIGLKLPYSIQNVWIVAAIVVIKTLHEIYIHLFPLSMVHNFAKRYPKFFVFFSPKLSTKLIRNSWATN